MSVGNVTQSINLDQSDVILVLGENMDLGGNDNRNGCGKTTILNALSYVLFGDPLTKIKLNNLINKINNKNMVVTVEFQKDGNHYHIERGRKPDILVFIKDGEDVVDQTQGENRVTQVEIERILGFNHTMFKHIVAMNTYTTPFLSSPAADQRQIIEDLLGISTLSEKAEILKAKIKNTKEDIKAEHASIKSIDDYNNSLNTTINTLIIKSKKWNEETEQSIIKLGQSISSYETLDIENEIHLHNDNELISDKIASYNEINSMRTTLAKQLNAMDKKRVDCENNLLHLSNSTCPTCKQHMSDADKMLEHHANQYSAIEMEINQLTEELNSLNALLSEDVPKKHKTFYSKLSDALNHKNTIENTYKQIEKLSSDKNPYDEQIIALQKDIKEINYDLLTDLTLYLEHQEFLLKLLTNKDSFIRKKIINQNITFLNSRIDHYLIKVGLPHTVKFLPELEVEISHLGKELDFDNLSRGERTRLILSMSWAFRDCYESLNEAINVLFVDELIDTGLDSSGVEMSLVTLKEMVRNSNKTVFLISHRDELLGRVDTTLKVIKENGFTSFEQN